ncbi:MAG TPA: hypothetical protein VMU95_17815 [Trebonia sp.]|nr:hypothetical protein [Trebonia sp.]
MTVRRTPSCTGAATHLVIADRDSHGDSTKPVSLLLPPLLDRTSQFRRLSILNVGVEDARA